uniref:Reverse transcriptase zinc-binding domain-containing protein n=1 Tax=Cannabis sativa TaxID=3483 RepID=A0A803NVY9_CANSA
MSFKARYFSTGSFLTASLGSNPSYIWRSVYEAKELVRAGVRRLVGDGSNIGILSEPWLPDELHPYIESSHPSLLRNTVNALMKDGMVEWDEEVIKDVLSDSDQKLVWKVPLSNHSRRDSWYWMQDDSGLFTVKSMYSLLQAAKTSSNVPNNSRFWCQLWHLKLPPKVVNFLWRVSTNSLPTRFQLSTKNIPIDPRCPFCLVAPETALHVLVRCSFAQSYWSQSHVPSIAPGAMVFTSWFDGGLKAWNVAKSLEAAMILWSIWKHRNELVWNSNQQDSNEVLSVAKLNYVDWIDARNKLVVAAESCVVGGVDKWTAPDFLFVKVNVDGALFSSHGRYGVGLVARTVVGIVMAARTLCKEGDLQPHIVEAIGIKEALSWSKANGWTSVIVESDCLKVISDLQKPKYMVSPYGHILYDCRNFDF